MCECTNLSPSAPKMELGIMEPIESKITELEKRVNHIHSLYKNRDTTVEVKINIINAAYDTLDLYSKVLKSLPLPLQSPSQFFCLRSVEAAAKVVKCLAKFFRDDGAEEKQKFWNDQKVSLLKQASELGSVWATGSLGDHYNSHDDDEWDAKKAVEYYALATKLSGKKKYSNKISEIYRDPRSINERPLIKKMLLDMSQKQTEFGIKVAGVAANLLGLCYDKDGDHVNELLWYRKAMDLGNRSAIDNIADCYQEGEGTQRDVKQAFFFCLEAIRRGHKNAHERLLILYEETSDSSLREYVRCELSAITQTRHPTQKCDAVCAIHENRPLQVLGHCYFSEELYEEAFGAYRKGAENGSPFCMSSLGGCYRDGIGVQKDFRAAIQWYTSAKETIVNCKEDIDFTYVDVTGDKEYFKEALEIEIKNCEQALKAV